MAFSARSFSSITTSTPQPKDSFRGESERMAFALITAQEFSQTRRKFAISVAEHKTWYYF
jgi:hypothetical protein